MGETFTFRVPIANRPNKPDMNGNIFPEDVMQQAWDKALRYKDSIPIFMNNTPVGEVVAKDSNWNAEIKLNDDHTGNLVKALFELGTFGVGCRAVFKEEDGVITRMRLIGFGLVPYLTEGGQNEQF